MSVRTTAPAQRELLRLAWRALKADLNSHFFIFVDGKGCTSTARCDARRAQLVRQLLRSRPKPKAKKRNPPRPPRGLVQFGPHHRCHRKPRGHQ